MKIVLEIRPGEGGEDARLLVQDQAAIYHKYADRHNLIAHIEDDAKSWLTILVEGEALHVKPLFKEAGGHRWQRVPPTEHKGRVHTSTVTVAVMPAIAVAQYTLNDKDIEVIISKDSGPGGQHRNKTESCVTLRHKPTAVEAKSATKCQHRNRQLAREVLESRVAALIKSREIAHSASKRKDMVGSGMRGDKIRTYRVRDNQVTDHKSNIKTTLSLVLAGGLEHVWG